MLPWASTVTPSAKLVPAASGLGSGSGMNAVTQPVRALALGEETDLSNDLTRIEDAEHQVVAEPADVAELGHVGLAGALYIVLRFVVRIAGGWLGGLLAGVPKEERHLTGLALMPQAGVAIGMALVAGERYPEYPQPLLAITIASTIFFELIGPALTQFALRRAALTEAKAST